MADQARINLAQNLVKWRKKRGMSQRDLARRAGLSRTRLGVLEADTTQLHLLHSNKIPNVTLRTLENLASALGVEICTLLEKS